MEMAEIVELIEELLKELGGTPATGSGTILVCSGMDEPCANDH